MKRSKKGSTFNQILNVSVKRREEDHVYERNNPMINYLSTNPTLWMKSIWGKNSKRGHGLSRKILYWSNWCTSMGLRNGPILLAIYKAGSVNSVEKGGITILTLILVRLLGWTMKNGFYIFIILFIAILGHLSAKISMAGLIITSRTIGTVTWKRNLPNIIGGSSLSKAICRSLKGPLKMSNVKVLLKRSCL